MAGKEQQNRPEGKLGLRIGTDIAGLASQSVLRARKKKENIISNQI